MTTGNTIWVGRVLLGNDRDNGLNTPLFYLAIIGAFFAGVVLHRWADIKFPSRGASRVSPMLALTQLICELCVFFRRMDPDAPEEPEPWLKWLVVVYAPLFGVVSGASADGRLASATTMVTGHVIALGKALANLPTKTFSYVEKCKLVMSLVVIVFSICGACLGATMYRVNGHRTRGLFLPVAPVLVVLLWLHDHLARPRKLVKMAQKAVREASKNKEGSIPAIAQEQETNSADSENEDDCASDDAESDGGASDNQPAALPKAALGASSPGA